MLCPNCRKEIDNDSRFCRFCGVEFVDDDSEIEKADSDVLCDYYEDDEDEAEIVIIPEESSDDTGKKKKRGFITQLFVILAVVLIVGGVLIFTGLSSGKIGKSKEVATDAYGEEIKPGWSSTVEIAVEDADGTVKQITSDSSLVTAGEILEEYTLVMNKLKTDAPAFSFLRYQNLPTEYQNLGAVADMVLPIIEKYVTSASASEKVDYPEGNSNILPVKESQYGCLLTDSSKIKKAYSEILSENRYKLVITLVDEMNPGHLSAAATYSDGVINAVFDPYDAAEQITAISSLVMNDINFNYTDCTVTLIYDYETKEVESLNMAMNIDITANTMIMDIKARIVDVTDFTDFVY